MPLLLVDFRDSTHVRRHELAQRSINQLTAGIIGVSHFANWYYFAGADLYDFVAGRWGTPQNQAARLDCYSQFRAALTLDTSLPAPLRSEMQRRIEAVTVNPMAESPGRQVDAASARYDELRKEAENGILLRRLELERRAEVASFQRGPGRMALDIALHTVTLGTYTHRVSKRTDTLQALDVNRRAQANLDFLAPLARAGTAPEVALQPERIEASVNELSALLPDIRSSRVREQATDVLKSLSELTQDSQLRSDCLFALGAIKRGGQAGIAAEPRVFTKPVTALADTGH
jgi:hypothetical protein